ncbi:MAG TPA: LON peptidase substrate-binding domain-containing protein [Methylomirabilota bacterium]|nr:LON peptidase substrate-binding domain-containing protein [Methylomirabilota bacterium]
MTPLFPLPDVVFFPKTLLPLHVYEPRYRALASEALEQDRIICTALLKPGWESDYYGSPEVYPVGCVGKIVQHQKLPDGRYNITLDGIAKVRIESSVQLTPYRLVRVSPVEDDATWARGRTRPRRRPSWSGSSDRSTKGRRPRSSSPRCSGRT